MVTSLERKIKKTACENKAVVQTYGEYIRGTGSLCSSLLGLNSFRYNLLVYFSNSENRLKKKKNSRASNSENLVYNRGICFLFFVYNQEI